jgi:DNA-binding response OmpR family regulator
MNLLLVEDETAFADALCCVLNQEDYRTDVVSDGEEGYARAVSGIYDLIILDVMLPSRDGLSILKELRRQKITTPVLLLTAKSQLEDKVRGLDLGADDYLTKPFMMEELLARLRVLARRQGNTIDHTLYFNDLELDVKQYLIRCPKTDKSVTLGMKEFQLLEIFMRNQNQIITKDQLIEKIWGYDNDAEYNNVEVYISFVRKKIQFIGAGVSLRAKRGIGYLMEGSV